MNQSRKSSRRPLVAVLSGLAVLVMQGCAIAGVAVHGRVMDVETGKPVAGAYVFAKSGHDNIRILDSGGPGYTVVDTALTRTDKDGYYRFNKRFHFGSIVAGKYGYIRVYAPGYTTAPEMVAKGWKSEIGETPEDYIADYIPAQYFYGTGDNRDNYNDLPLNSSHRVYYLSSRPVAQYDIYTRAPTIPNLAVKFEKNEPQAQPRIRYLRSVLGKMSAPYEITRKLALAMYEEAIGIAKTKADYRAAHDIADTYKLNVK